MIRQRFMVTMQHNGPEILGDGELEPTIRDAFAEENPDLTVDVTEIGGPPTRSPVVVAYTRLLRAALKEREAISDAGGDLGDEWFESNDNVAEAAQNLVDALEPEGAS